MNSIVLRVQAGNTRTVIVSSRLNSVPAFFQLFSRNSQIFDGMEATSFDRTRMQPAAGPLPSAAWGWWGGAGQAAPCDIRPDDSQQSQTSSSTILPQQRLCSSGGAGEPLLGLDGSNNKSKALVDRPRYLSYLYTRFRNGNTVASLLSCQMSGRANWTPKVLFLFRR